MNVKKLLLLNSLFSLFLVKKAQAHCPLCTIGAAAAAGGAAWFGISPVVIGLFIGAFAVSMGWWISRLIKKRYVPLQRLLIISLSFATTVLPLFPVMRDVYPVYISLTGDYGSLLNRTYLLNLFLVGSIIGGVIVSLTPWLSSKITMLRKGRTFPFQGVILTMLLLVIVGATIQLVVM
jgi:hypothetical protein